jgi:hypothetical protein
MADKNTFGISLGMSKLNPHNKSIKRAKRNKITGSGPPVTSVVQSARAYT